MSMNTSEPRHRREQVSARLDPDVLEIVEREAKRDRRPIGALVRNIVEDWARERRDSQPQEAA
jgi:hypothetical protein